MGSWQPDGLALPVEQARSAHCLHDSLRHDFGLPSTTRYALVTYDYAGKRIGATAMVATGTRTCLPMRPGIERDAYTIARVEVRRNGRALPVAFVHLAKGPKGMRVVGIDRR